MVILKNEEVVENEITTVKDVTVVEKYIVTV